MIGRVFAVPRVVRALSCGAVLAAAAGCSDGVGHPLIAMADGGGGAGSSAAGRAAASGGRADSLGGSGAALGSLGGSTQGGASAGGVGAGRGGAGPSVAGRDSSFGGFDVGFGGDDGWFGGGGRRGNGTGGVDFGRGGRGNDFGPGTNGGENGGPENDVPESAHCEPSAMWPASFDAEEQSFLEVVNVLRALGTRCGGDGGGGGGGDRESMPIDELRMKPELRCSARLHSLDMATREFFDEVNPDGEEPAERIVAAGYSAGITQETIAQSEQSGGASPTEGALQRLVMNGGVDCEILIDPRFDSIGVGYYEGLWTIDVAGPRP